MSTHVAVMVTVDALDSANRPAQPVGASPGWATIGPQLFIEPVAAAGTPQPQPREMSPALQAASHPTFVPELKVEHTTV